MPNNCSVYGCYNRKRNTKDHGISYFTFPKDEEARKKWVYSCHRSDKINTNNAVICSAHFADEHFEDDLKARILNIQRRILKKDAVPTIGLYKGKLEFVLSLYTTKRLTFI